MEEKEMQPTIQMKIAALWLWKTHPALYSDYFSFYYSSQSLFENRNALNVRDAKRKRLEQKSKRPSILESLLLFFVISINIEYYSFYITTKKGMAAAIPFFHNKL